jgi:hypothetical protein
LSVADGIRINQVPSLLSWLFIIENIAVKLLKIEILLNSFFSSCDLRVTANQRKSHRKRCPPVAQDGVSSPIPVHITQKLIGALSNRLAGVRDPVTLETGSIH